MQAFRWAGDIPLVERARDLRSANALIIQGKYHADNLGFFLDNQQMSLFVWVLPITVGSECADVMAMFHTAVKCAFDAV